MVTSTLDPDLVRDGDTGNGNGNRNGSKLGVGHDNAALGYGDSSDSGSDLSGLHVAGSDSDSQGTGERASVDPDSGRIEGDIDDEDIEDTDLGEDFAENDEIDPDLPVEDDPAPSEEEQIRHLKQDIDEIEDD